MRVMPVARKSKTVRFCDARPNRRQLRLSCDCCVGIKIAAVSENAKVIHADSKKRLLSNIESRTLVCYSVIAVKSNDVIINTEIVYR